MIIRRGMPVTSAHDRLRRIRRRPRGRLYESGVRRVRERDAATRVSRSGALSSARGRGSNHLDLASRAHRPHRLHPDHERAGRRRVRERRPPPGSSVPRTRRRAAHQPAGDRRVGGLPRTPGRPRSQALASHRDEGCRRVATHRVAACPGPACRASGGGHAAPLQEGAAAVRTAAPVAHRDGRVGRVGSGSPATPRRRRRPGLRPGRTQRRPDPCRLGGNGTFDHRHGCRARAASQ